MCLASVWKLEGCLESFQDREEEGSWVLDLAVKFEVGYVQNNFQALFRDFVRDP